MTSSHHHHHQKQQLISRTFPDMRIENFPSFCWTILESATVQFTIMEELWTIGCRHSFKMVLPLILWVVLSLYLCMLSPFILRYLHYVIFYHGTAPIISISGVSILLICTAFSVQNLDANGITNIAIPVHKLSKVCFCLLRVSIDYCSKNMLKSV
jgi:hypothetical protein